MNTQIEEARIKAETATNSLGKGFFLPCHNETCFESFDGSDVAAWLESEGYVVVGFEDVGTNGIARTACGFTVSTNGYVCFG